MDQAIETVLAEYEARSKAEWSGRLEGSAQMGRDVRDRMLLSVGREAGELLNLLARSNKAARILELGTSYGYSTIWLAAAARDTGGVVISLDVADYKQAHAAAQLERAGLRDRVQFHVGDALEIIPTLEDGIDFVLLDIWKDLYEPCLEAFLPKLAPGALIVADNMLQPAADRTNALGYRRLARSKATLSSILLPVGQGLEVSRVLGPDDKGL